MLRKLLVFIISILVMVLLLGSFSKSNNSWEGVLNDVELLKDNNYVFYLENNEENLDDANKEFFNLKLNITSTNIIGFCKENINVIYFEEI